jgi:hypothetical protein
MATRAQPKSEPTELRNVRQELGLNKQLPFNGQPLRINALKFSMGRKRKHVLFNILEEQY